MLIEPVAYIAAACLLFAAGLGTRELVEWVRGEIAFSRAIRGRLDAFAVRWQEQTGQPWGPIGNVPEHMANPVWARDLPDPGEYQPESPVGDEIPNGDDEDAYPRDLRMSLGAGRLLMESREDAFPQPVEVRGDARQTVWPANRGPGAHRLRGDDTQDLRVYASAFVDVSEVAAS